MEYYDILKTIKQIRINKKITQQEIANYLNISQQSYSDLEKAKTKLTLVDFFKICKKLNISPINLIKEDNQIIITINEKQAETLKDLNWQFQIQNKK